MEVRPTRVIATIGALLVAGACAAALPGSAAEHPHREGASAAVQQAVSGEPGGQVLRVAIWADQDFVRAHGPRWRDEARAVVMSSAGLMGGVDVELAVVEVTRWASSPADLPAMVDQAVRRPHRDDAVVVALTSHDGRQASVFDGYARSDLGVMMVKIADPPSPHVAALVAHELGHLLGADHHEEGHECGSDGCLMDPVGFEHADRWCGDHRAEIAEMLAGAA